MDPRQNRPAGREKEVTGSASAHRRGDGLGTGPVGSSGGHAGQNSSGGGNGRKTITRAAGGGGLLAIIGALIAIFAGGGLGGGGGNYDFNDGGALPYQDTQSGYSQQQQSNTASNTQQADTSVAQGTREKRTQILGNEQDKITFMIYMCGTDLESKNGMASSDMQEIAGASYGDNVNVIVYTGGCKGWKINGISTQTNQIYQIRDGKLNRLEADMGAKAMTDPATLTEFINYCTKNFPANRNELIFWDHGGGSVTGYGYDEKFASKGSMDLAGISRALKNSGTTFDFIGFDACLMATAENALMLNNYADYLIASEETEPGIGWYYTDWMTKLGQNTSMPTVELGKNIVDDFVTQCGRKCPGQLTTLSVIDLAEFANTVPSDLTAFADSVSTQLSGDQFQGVSDARNQTREFAASSRIDQIDLVHFALNRGTAEGKALSESIKGAVKYNRTGANMTNAYGVSIFFPSKSPKYVSSASNTYAQINMDSSYTKCINMYAKMTTSGQIAAGGSDVSSPFGSLFGSILGGGGSSSGSAGSADLIGQLLSGFMGGTSDRSIAGLDASNIGFMEDDSLSDEYVSQYIANNSFDPANLVWQQKGSDYILSLPEAQWKLVNQLDRGMFISDGDGMIDLGLDNTYAFDDDGNLIADLGKDWLAVNGQPVAYYHTESIETADGWAFYGYIPAMLNGDRVKLLVAFDKDHKSGYITGAEYDYRSGETDTVAKSATELNVGDTLDFVCDYYTKDGTYEDSYYLGDQMIVSEEMKLSNVKLEDGEAEVLYCFTDIYGQRYWTEKLTAE